MQRVQANSAIQDKTFNNLKASRGSVNDLYTQSITKITSDREPPVEVFGTLTSLAETNRVLREQVTALVTRLAALETRVNDLVAE